MTSTSERAPRPGPRGGYSRLLAEIQAAVRRAVPRGRTVLVVSRGDQQLVRLEGHRGWHFPRHPDGRYGGYHPEDSQAAIAHLEELRAQGAQYLVFPETALWWLDYYGGLREHLEGRYRLLSATESCHIYDVCETAAELGGAADGVDATAADQGGASRAEDGRPDGDPSRGPGLPQGASGPARQIRELVDRLLPASASLAVLGTGEGDGSAGEGGRSAGEGGGSPGVGGGPAVAAASPALTALGREHAVAFEPNGGERSAAAELERLREQGVEFLLIPRAAFAWLEAHPGFQRELLERHRFVTRQRHLCEIYELSADG